MGSLLSTLRYEDAKVILSIGGIVPAAVFQGQTKDPRDVVDQRTKDVRRMKDYQRPSTRGSCVVLGGFRCGPCKCLVLRTPSGAGPYRPVYELPRLARRRDVDRATSLRDILSPLMRVFVSYGMLHLCISFACVDVTLMTTNT
jgi:hypothetical protein